MSLLSKKIISVLLTFGKPVPLKELFFHSDLRYVFNDLEVTWDECFNELIDRGVVIVDEKNCYSVVDSKLEEVLSA